MSTSPVAGWYPDPQSPGSQRFWDGSVWTDQVRPASGAVPPPPPPSPSSFDWSAGPVQGFGPAAQAPKNYLVWAVLTILCCWPVGIFAIVNAARVNGAWARGDHAAALSYSDNAKKFTVAAYIGGAIALVLSLLYGVE